MITKTVVPRPALDELLAAYEAWRAWDHGGRAISDRELIDALSAFVTAVRRESAS